MSRVSMFNSPLLLGFEQFERTLDRENEMDVGEMASLLRKAVRPVLSDDGDFGSVAEGLDGYTLAPPHV